MPTFSYIKWLARDSRAKPKRGMLEAENDEAAREAIKQMMDADERRQLLEFQLFSIPHSTPNTDTRLAPL